MERDYVFFDKRRIAWRDSTGVHYYFTDSAGSTRVVTDSSGNTCFQADYYPYGQENDYNTTCSPTYKFTGYEFDSETGNYYAYAREYDPRIGRFLSADPLGGAIGDPQSLNRYSYVLNNPESLIDPSGMGPQQWGGACGSTDGDPNPCPPPPPPGTTWYLTGDDLCGIFPGPWCGGPGGPGLGAGTEGVTPDVSKQYQETTPCSLTAPQVMASVEGNFARFADYSRWLGAETVTFLPPSPLRVGSTIPIGVGTFGTLQYISVTVQSVGSQSMTFTTNPGHLLYPGSITFSASTTSAGSTEFGISLSGTFPNLARRIEFDLGGSAFEDAEWSSFLAQVKDLCKGKR